jgi:hypothetical protein
MRRHWQAAAGKRAVNSEGFMSNSNPQQGGPVGTRQLLLSIKETCSHVACGRSYLHDLRREHRLLTVETGGRMAAQRR